MPVELDIRRMADHQALQAARLRMQAGQAHELAFDLLPVRQGIQEKALITIDRHHELPLATLRSCSR